jgi:hypothetical protein
MSLNLDLLPKSIIQNLKKKFTPLIEGLLPNNRQYRFKICIHHDTQTALRSAGHTSFALNIRYSFKTHNNVHPCFLIRVRFSSVIAARRHTVTATHIKLKIQFPTLGARLNPQNVLR